MFLFQLFQFLSLVERLLDRKTGRIDRAWAPCFQREPGRQRKEEEEEEEKRSSCGGGEQKTRVGKHVSG
jgi:hypothetical protein